MVPCITYEHHRHNGYSELNFNKTDKQMRPTARTIK